jgi:hypothetical protein
VGKVVERLPSKCKALSSNLSTAKTKKNTSAIFISKKLLQRLLWLLRRKTKGIKTERPEDGGDADRKTRKYKGKKHQFWTQKTSGQMLVLTVC